VLESYSFAGWRIIYVETQVSENAFLFFRENPKPAKFMTMWAGAAMTNEGAETERWVLDNAPGIPHALASCFAFHVTVDRTQ